MGKVRVFELSKQVNIPSKDLVDLLNSLGVPTANHMSAIDENAAKYVLRKYGPNAEKEKPAPPKVKSKPLQKPQAPVAPSDKFVEVNRSVLGAPQQPMRLQRQAPQSSRMQTPLKPIPGQAPRAAALQQAAQRLLQAQEEQKVIEARLLQERIEAENLEREQAAIAAQEARKAEEAASYAAIEADKKRAIEAREEAKRARLHKKEETAKEASFEELPKTTEAAKAEIKSEEQIPVVAATVAIAEDKESEAPQRLSEVKAEAEVKATITEVGVAALPIYSQTQAPAVAIQGTITPRPAAQQAGLTPATPRPIGQGTGTATYRQSPGVGTGTATYRQSPGVGTGTATYRQSPGVGTGTATYRQSPGVGTGTATYRQSPGVGTGTATYRQGPGVGTGTATYRQNPSQGTYGPRPQGQGTFAPRPQGPGGPGSYGPRPQGTTGGFGPRRPQGTGGALNVPPPAADAPISKGKGKSWGSTGKERRFTSEDDSMRGPIKGKAAPAKKGKKGMAQDSVLDKRLRNVDVEMLDEDGNVVRKSIRKRERPAKSKKIIVEPGMTVRDLALKMEVTPGDLIKKLMSLGVMAGLNQTIDSDTAQVVASEFGVETELKSEAEQRETSLTKVEDKPETLKTRPPVITIMGHVDHGKTSLLDEIRKTNVAAGEAGGITQAIGAYQVEIKGRKITFIDTPGHEAFTSMRARGAQVTDIVVLVVAADDGVMPQTREAYNHAKSAGVPIVVAINKIDKPNAQPDRVLQELSELGLVAEKWGGDAVTVEVSALKKIGIAELLEMILLVADMKDLKANFDRPAQGTVIEAKMDSGLGPVATVLIKNGTLKRGDPFLAGEMFGRVRAMMNDKGETVDEAPPSTPVRVFGLAGVPNGGDQFEVVKDEREAKLVAQRRADIRKLKEMVDIRQPITLEDFFAQKKAGAVKDLNIIIKADVQGSEDALKQSLEKLSNSEVRVVTIHSGVGAVSVNDVMLAATSGSIIIAFGVRPDSSAARAAEESRVDIKSYRIIYEVIDDVTLAMEGMLEPEYKEIGLGKAEVRAVFSVPKAGNIAGSYVTSGKITRNATARIVRDGKIIHEGKITSLRRFKDDAKEVQEGFECGIGFETFNDIKEGDIIEAYGQELIKRFMQPNAQ